MIGPNQLEILEYLNSFATKITNDAKRKREIISRIAMENVAFIKNKTVFINRLGLNLRKKSLNATFRIVLYRAVTWTLGKADRKDLESFEMCAGERWRR
jgi:hypothetical protein